MGPHPSTYIALLWVIISYTHAIIVEHPDKSKHITAFPLSDTHSWNVECSKQYEQDEVQLAGCTPKAGGKCDRVLMDNFINEDEVSTLISIAQKVIVYMKLQ